MFVQTAYDAKCAQRGFQRDLFQNLILTVSNAGVRISGKNIFDGENIYIKNVRCP